MRLGDRVLVGLGVMDGKAFKRRKPVLRLEGSVGVEDGEDLFECGPELRPSVNPEEADLKKGHLHLAWPFEKLRCFRELGAETDLVIRLLAKR